ncbi:MAG: (2Fe-2S)-binding protein [Deltaproteobacteria bacterium]|nr:(2Fe-2S)-binding protein [Deltaproteobacteria bacterium]
MDKIRFTINSRQVVADKGAAILEVALQNDIYIPHLCYHPSLKPRGVCRLCTVEVNGGGLATACRTLAEEGMEVRTRSPDVDRAVRPIIELLIADHHASCRGCPSSGRCELQRIMANLRIDRRRVRRLRATKKELPMETLKPGFDYEPNKCVRCGICVQTCEDLHGTSCLYFMERGYGTRIVFFGDKSKCESCLECVVRCPVGVLISKKT